MSPSASSRRSLLHLLLPLLLLLLLLLQAEATSSSSSKSTDKLKAQPIGRVNSKGPALAYHNGSLLVGTSSNKTILVHVIFYGNFTRLQRHTVRRFLRSFPARPGNNAPSPSVVKWWAITGGFVNKKSRSVAPCVRRGREFRDTSYSMGLRLNLSSIQSLVVSSYSAGKSPDPAANLYLVLISGDVKVKGLCKRYCGQHSSTSSGLPFAWISDTGVRCPDECSWPFGPGGVKPPNGEPGLDGIIVNMAEMLSGMATNPQLKGYFRQSSGDIVQEAVGFCKDTSALPPGLLKNRKTGASFNVYGFRNSQFLLPWMWDPSTNKCAIQGR